jgi:hypothetical protein
MSTAARLAAFAALLAAVFGVGFGIGAVAGPETSDVDPPPTHEMEHSP